MESLKDDNVGIIVAALTGIAAVITSVIKLRKLLKEPSRVVQQIQRDLDQLLDFIEDDLVNREPPNAQTRHRLKTIEQMRKRLRHIDGMED